MYRIDNGKFDNHWISAKYFGEIKNMKWTFTQTLKDL
jgi:predicted SnoaL-like aldol condensation-catalyzing enzyme